MIEINRKLYMNENTGEKLSAFNQMKEVIEGVVKAIIPNMKIWEVIAKKEEFDL